MLKWSLELELPLYKGLLGAETNIKVQYPGNTVRAWKAIREEFLKRYNPAGETVARQLNTLIQMKWDPLAESIDSFAYHFGQMFSGLQGEYTDALFMGCIPEVYKTHLLGITAMRDIIKRIKEVQILLGHTLQPAVQWATQPYNPYYPYNGGQNLYGQAPQNPPFPPQQGTALAQPSVPPNTTSQPKLNFMAGKSVSFAPEVETVHWVKEVITPASPK